MVFNLNASISISYSYQKDEVKTETMQSGENLSSAIQHNINGFIYLNNNIISLIKITQTFSINSFCLSLTNLACFKLAVSMNNLRHGLPVIVVQGPFPMHSLCAALWFGG